MGITVHQIVDYVKDPRPVTKTVGNVFMAALVTSWSLYVKVRR